MGNIMNKILVQTILDRLNKCLNHNRYAVHQREKNRRFIQRHTLSDKQIKNILSKLTVDDYWKSEPSEVSAGSYVHLFFMQVTLDSLAGETNTITLYVKFELIELSCSEKSAALICADEIDEDNIERTVVISFHEAEWPAEYAFR